MVPFRMAFTIHIVLELPDKQLGIVKQAIINAEFVPGIGEIVVFGDHSGYVKSRTYQYTANQTHSVTLVLENEQPS